MRYGEVSGRLVILRARWKRIRFPEGKDVWGDHEIEDLLNVGFLCGEGGGELKKKRNIRSVMLNGSWTRGPGERFRWYLPLVINVTDRNEISQGEGREQGSPGLQLPWASGGETACTGDHTEEEREAGGNHQVSPKPKEKGRE